MVAGLAALPSKFALLGEINVSVGDDALAVVAKLFVGRLAAKLGFQGFVDRGLAHFGLPFDVSVRD